MFENVDEKSLIQISITDTGIGLQETEMTGLFVFCMLYLQ